MKMTCCRWLQCLLKVVSSDGVLSSDRGAGQYFDFSICRHFVLNMFPFLLSTDQFLGKVCHNRQSAANKFPRFAYSFMPLLHYTAPILFALWFLLRLAKHGEKKIRDLLLLAWQERLICFKCRLLQILYNPNTIGTTSLVTLHVFFANSHIYYAVLTGNGNIEDRRKRQIQKQNSAPCHSMGPVYLSIDTTFDPP
jgi:hypothetical protein